MWLRGPAGVRPDACNTFKLMSLLYGTGSQIALNFRAAAGPAGLAGALGAEPLLLI